MSSWCSLMTRHVITWPAAAERSCAMGTDVWILGGTGRSGRAIAAELVSRGITPVLVGRDAARLAEAAALAGQDRTVQAGQDRTMPAGQDRTVQAGQPRTVVAGSPRTVVAGSVEAMAAEIRRQQPAVVINKNAPFT